MSLSAQELKALYDQYDADGKFDYLKSIRLNDDHATENLHLRTRNVMKVERKESLYQLTSMNTVDFWRMRNAGKKTFHDLRNYLIGNGGFVFDYTVDYSWYNESVHDVLDTCPNFRSLVENGELDTYLAEGERLANKRNPNWRTEWDLPLKPQKMTREEQHITDFVLNHISDSPHVGGHFLKKELGTTSARHDSEIFKDLDGKKNKEGDGLDYIGDLILIGREKLMSEFNVSQEQISILDNALGSYNLTLDIAANIRETYWDNIAQRSVEAERLHNDPVATRKGMKLARYNKFFPEPEL